MWAEPSVVERAHYEFGQTEEFLQHAEALTFPYEWQRSVDTPCRMDSVHPRSRPPGRPSLFASRTSCAMYCSNLFLSCGHDKD